MSSSALPKSPVSSSPIDVVPTSLFDRRAYWPEKLCSVMQDFCNTICHERTHAAQKTTSSLIRSPHALLADLATDDIAEQFPTLAAEFLELHLFDRGEVSRAGADRDAGQKTLLRQTPDARCLPHNIFAGKIVTAGF
jgi:hypothetical protein